MTYVVKAATCPSPKGLEKESRRWFGCEATCMCVHAGGMRPIRSLRAATYARMSRGCATTATGTGLSSFTTHALRERSSFAERGLHGDTTPDLTRKRYP